MVPGSHCEVFQKVFSRNVKIYGAYRFLRESQVFS